MITLGKLLLHTRTKQAHEHRTDIRWTDDRRKTTRLCLFLELFVLNCSFLNDMASCLILQLLFLFVVCVGLGGKIVRNELLATNRNGA